MNQDSHLVYDPQGRAYRLPVDFELHRYRSTPATYAGLAGNAVRAPEPPSTPCPTPEDLESAQGHHFHELEEFYHTEWKWGELEFTGQDGRHGVYLCYHAHLSPESALANYDPSCEMLLLEEPSEDEEEFVVAL